MAYYTTTDGVQLYFEEFGDGQPLLLVHGFGTTHDYYERNIPVLAESFHVVTLDLRGHGKSSSAKTGAHISRLATDIHELLNHLDLNHVTFLGWSMGASIGWSYWELFQADRLAKFIFVDEPELALDTPKNHWGFLDYNGLLELSEKLRANLPLGMKNMIENTQADPGMDTSDLVKASSTGNPDFQADLLINHGVTDWHTVVKSITLPTLVISGDGHFFNADLIKAVHQDIPNSQFEYFEHFGHFLFFEDPEHFNQVVHDFTKN